MTGTGRPRTHEASPTAMELLSGSFTRLTISELTNPTAIASRFESLPRELRNAIYEALWHHTPVIEAKYNGYPMQLQFAGTECNQGDKDGRTRGQLLPKWLQTCSTVLYEGLDELRRQSLWSVGRYHEAVAEPLASSLTSTKNTTSALLDPTTAKALTICTWRGLSSRGLHERTFRLRNSDFRLIRDVVGNLSTIMKLRKLRLKVTLSGPRYFILACQAMDQCELNLKRLDRYLHHLLLDTFELEVRAPRHKRKNVHDSTITYLPRTTFQEPFAREVERVGRICVGVEASVVISSSPTPDGFQDDVLFTISS